ncbi:MAG: hypothetical protein MK141_14245 [Pseudoxanthomonas sp.]|uniref:phage minor head protein n=1 Tax=Pseudoxanthomonas sp. TaxID=1871049 RepID=UPI00258B4C86|nr:phage minor head protein [Pseudoxanthomonas sp.]MCH2092720.1 hypothetical protein [Pseudoxanthomonas sp.]
MSQSFDDEVKRQAKRLPAIRADTQREILRQLQIAQRTVLAELASANEASIGRLTRQKAAIAAAIERFSRQASASADAGLRHAWSAGIDLVGKPADAAGLQLGPRLAIDDRQLRAMRTFTTNRIKDVTVRTVDRINGSLAQVIIGTKPMSTAITEIQEHLGGVARRRAMTIAYHEVGQAYATASYESMVAAEKLGVKLAKRWVKSGKMHPRPSHVQAHNQMRRVSEPFEILDKKTGELEKIRYPRDPQASPGNTINCGCLMVPVLDGSTFGASVVSIPDDPKRAIGKVSRAERDADSRAKVARTNDRLARFLELPADTPGITIITSSTAKPIVPK